MSGFECSTIGKKEGGKGERGEEEEENKEGGGRR